MVGVDWSIVSKSPQPSSRMKLKRLTAKPHMAIIAGTYLQLLLIIWGKVLNNELQGDSPSAASRGLFFFLGS